MFRRFRCRLLQLLLLSTMVPAATAGTVSTGFAHACAIEPDRSVSCWGSNQFGELGQGSSGAPRATPQHIATLSQIVQLASGLSHSCALRDDGQVLCWGKNDFGQIGVGAGLLGAVVAEPMPVPGLADVVRISAGASHTCALRQNGTAVCWGSNVYRQNGSGSAVNTVPEPAGDVALADIADIAAGGFHTCAVTVSGQAYCWGQNAQGQVGTGTLGGMPVLPQPVQNVTAARAIAAGSAHSCVVTAEGALSCWGSNQSGQLGRPPLYSDSPSAAPVSGIQDVLSVVAGGMHTCVLRMSGEVSCWGDNAQGQLATGMTGPPTYEPQQVGGSILPVDLSAGFRFACAVDAFGTVACWGENARGQLGNGETGEAALTPAAVLSMASVVSIDVGEMHSCAVAEGGVYCWGSNIYGRVGQVASNVDFDTPQLVAGMSGAVEVAIGKNHSCARTSDGAVFCWGMNEQGELGSGSSGGDSALPAQVAQLNDAVLLAVGGSHSCALKLDGTVACWGSNQFGQLGDPLVGESLATPKVVQGLSNVSALAAGESHTCALTAEGTGFCWGKNTDGQLGIGANLPSMFHVPQPVTGLGDLVAIAVGANHSCATRLIDGQAPETWCWGDDTEGQLGNGEPMADQYAPQLAFSGQGVLRAGGSSTCVLGAGDAMCWGSNWLGQIGAPAAGAYAAPVSAPAIAALDSLALGVNHSCGVTANATAACTGTPGNGQRGDGVLGYAAVPQAIDAFQALPVRIFGHSFEDAPLSMKAMPRTRGAESSLAARRGVSSVSGLSATARRMDRPERAAAAAAEETGPYRGRYGPEAWLP